MAKLLSEPVVGELCQPLRRFFPCNGRPAPPTPGVIAMVGPDVNVHLVDQQVVAWEDADLVTLIRSGGDTGRQAERALCQRYGRRIFLYGVRHLRDEDEARELIQQVLVVAL